MSDLSRRSMLAATSTFLYIKPELVRGAGKEKLKAGVIGSDRDSHGGGLPFYVTDMRREPIGWQAVFLA